MKAKISACTPGSAWDAWSKCGIAYIENGGDPSPDAICDAAERLAKIRGHFESMNVRYTIRKAFNEGAAVAIERLSEKEPSK